MPDPVQEEIKRLADYHDLVAYTLRRSAEALKAKGHGWQMKARHSMTKMRQHAREAQRLAKMLDRN